MWLSSVILVRANSPYLSTKLRCIRPEAGCTLRETNLAWDLPLPEVSARGGWTARTLQACAKAQEYWPNCLLSGELPRPCVFEFGQRVPWFNAAAFVRSFLGRGCGVAQFVDFVGQGGSALYPVLPERPTPKWAINVDRASMGGQFADKTSFNQEVSSIDDQVRLLVDAAALVATTTLAPETPAPILKLRPTPRATTMTASEALLESGDSVASGRDGDEEASGDDDSGTTSCGQADLAIVETTTRTIQLAPQTLTETSTKTVLSTKSVIRTPPPITHTSTSTSTIHKTHTPEPIVETAILTETETKTLGPVTKTIVATVTLPPVTQTETETDVVVSTVALPAPVPEPKDCNSELLSAAAHYSSDCPPCASDTLSFPVGTVPTERVSKGLEFNLLSSENCML